MTRNREFRNCHNHIDKDGKVTLRHDGKLRHLGVRNIHGRKKVVMLIDTEEVTVLDPQTSEILSRHLIDPARNYWPDKQKSPGRWRGDSDQILSRFSRLFTFVEVRGFEPLTFCMPCRRATNCAIPP